MCRQEQYRNIIRSTHESLQHTIVYSRIHNTTLVFDAKYTAVLRIYISMVVVILPLRTSHVFYLALPSREWQRQSYTVDCRFISFLRHVFFVHALLHVPGILILFSAAPQQSASRSMRVKTIPPQHTINITYDTSVLDPFSSRVTEKSKTSLKSHPVAPPTWRPK